jgi:hypothetical protein
MLLANIKGPSSYISSWKKDVADTVNLINILSLVRPNVTLVNKSKPPVTFAFNSLLSAFNAKLLFWGLSRIKCGQSGGGIWA